MTQLNRNLNILIQGSNTLAQIVRHQLNDKQVHSLTYVLGEQGSPIGYARRIVKQSKVRLFETFGQAIQEQFPHLSTPLKKAWEYDYLIEAGIVFRITHLYPNPGQKSKSLYVQALLAFLLLEDDACPTSAFSGLPYFSNQAAFYLSSSENIIAKDSEFRLIQRLIATIGSINEPHWLLHQSEWYKALADHRDRLRTLRAFLYMTIVSAVMVPEHFKRLFEIDKTEFLSYAEDLVHLIEDDETTRADIVFFLNKVELICSDIPSNILSSGIFHQPYRHCHRQLLGDTDVTQGQISNGAQTPQWDFLNELDLYTSAHHCLEDGVALSPIVEELTDVVMTKDYKTFLSYDAESYPTHKSTPRTKVLSRRAVSDRIHLTLVRRRILALKPTVEPQDLNEYLSSKAQIMLVDNNDTYRGLSLLDYILTFNQRHYSSFMTEREMETASLLIWAWRQFGYDQNKLTPAWSSYFDDPEIVTSFRKTMAVFIELLNTPRECDLVPLLGMTRDTIFQHIENLCELMLSSPTREEIYQFFTMMPDHVYASGLIFWDSLLWAAPFDVVQSHPEE